MRGLSGKMERQKNDKNISVRWDSCIGVKIDQEAFPPWFFETILDVSNSISVSHESLYHFLVSTLNYCLLHSDISLEDKDWSEPVLVWNLVIAVSGSRKTLIYKECTKLLKDAENMLRELDNVEIKQMHFNEGTVERVGTIMEENLGKLSILQDEASRLYLFTLNIV